MPSSITYEVFVDWDNDDCMSTPDFSEAYDDISNDVNYITFVRGEDREEGNSPASTLEINIKGSLYSKYSMFNTTGDLYGLLLPYRMVRVRAYFNSTWYNMFFGYISKIKVNPSEENPEVYIYCTDGLDLLARTLVSQDWGTRTSINDGDAVGYVLDATGWSSTRRDLDTDGGTLQYPVTTDYGGI